MTMDLPVFYAPPESIVGDVITLSATESRHAVKALRLRRGDLVMVIDGLGRAYRGELTMGESAGRRQVTIVQTLRGFGEPLVKLTLAAGLSTASKFDTVVQKGTELGVSRFIPLLTEKSRIRIEDSKKAASKQKRLERVALSAAKQSRRSLCPAITLPTTFDSLLEQIDKDDLKLIFHRDAPGASSVGKLVSSDTRRVTALVGPESGFSADEVTRAVAAGFHPISLGPRVLRTETAGPAVCALIMSALGELN
jgi:16S rRNA (uracil1498-N3)-methyltransferase